MALGNLGEGMNSLLSIERKTSPSPCLHLLQNACKKHPFVPLLLPASSWLVVFSIA